MRKSLGVLVFGAGVLLGYASRPVPVSAQPDVFPGGTSVRLTVQDFVTGPTIACKVIGIRDKFIGCEGDERQRPTRWVNLRYVQEITPTAER